MSVAHFKSFSLDNVFLITPKPNNHKGLNAAIINNAAKGSLLIESPFLFSQFGLSFFDASNGTDETKKKWSISVNASPNVIEKEEDITQFFDLARAIDEKLIDYGLEHSQLLFKKSYKPSQRDVVEALFKKCVKPSVGKDGKVYADKIDIKLNKKPDGTPDLLVFKENNEPLSFASYDDLKTFVGERVCLKIILQFKIYIMPNSYGITLLGCQLRIPSDFPPKTVIRLANPVSYAFAEPIGDIDFGDDEDEEN